jgi:hypothetical protein
MARAIAREFSKKFRGAQIVGGGTIIIQILYMKFHEPGLMYIHTKEVWFAELSATVGAIDCYSWLHRNMLQT